MIFLELKEYDGNSYFTSLASYFLPLFIILQ